MTDVQSIADMFRILADIDFEDASPLWARLTREAADDPEVLTMLLPAAPRDRLPHLLLAAVQYELAASGADAITTFGAEPYAAFRSWCIDHRDELEGLTATRFVQTNEVGRCAALLPCLSFVARQSRQPLAVLEVGASAGLNLRFDTYRYVYGEQPPIGPDDSRVVLQPRLVGDGRPDADFPTVTWRIGVDRRPVDVGNDDDVRWIRSCLWPEQHWRRELFDAAIDAARDDPPELVTGDAMELLADLVGRAPDDAALCVVHTAVIAYLPDPPAFVQRLRELARDRPIWWVSGEAPGLVPPLVTSIDEPDSTTFAYGVVPLGVDVEPRVLAHAGSHGAWMRSLVQSWGR
jgi:hypothetical protein